MENLERARELFFEGVSCFEREHFGQAELKFRESLQLAPDRVSTMTNLSATLIKQNKFDEARDLCLKLISIDNGLADAWNYLGVIDQHQSGPDSAVANFDKALRINPDDPTVLNNKGISLDELGESDAALECFNKAIAHRHDYAEAYYHRGNTLKKLKRWDEALASYARAIELKPDYPDAHRNCAAVMEGLRPPVESPNPDQRAMTEAEEAYLRGDWSVAEAVCRRLISIKGDNSDALNLLGIVAAQTNRPQEAADLLGRAIAVNPDDADAHNNLGNVFRELGRLDEALDRFDKVISLNPAHAEVYYNRGNVLRDLKRLEEAKNSYDRAIATKPDFPDVYNSRGVVLQELGRLRQALDSYDHALKLNPEYVAAHYNRGNVLRALKQPQDALESYDRALRIMPDFADAHCGRGGALLDLGRQGEGLRSYDRAIELNPDYAAAYFNRGCALQKLQRLSSALDSFDRALQLRPDYADAYQNRGDTLQALQRLDEAFDSYDRALRINAAQDFLYGDWLHTRMKLCAWTDAGQYIAEFTKRIQDGEKSTPPFAVLSLVDSLVLQRKAAEIWVANRCPANFALPSIPRRARSNKIRLAYFSSDYRIHPITYLMAELFERHDRTRFELIGFSLGSHKKDEMRERVAAAFDRFVDVQDRSDRDVALLARDTQIDIAIDLNGFTAHARSAIFSHRAAPIQVHYLGYPGTFGAEYFDYLVADATLIPASFQGHYAEKIIYLPNTYQVNDRKRQIASRQFSRKELGLPETGFVFCCFNNSYKITPDTFDGWIRILKQVEGSVLWLVADNSTAAANLRKEAEERGLAAERLIFAERMPLPEHLARHRAADLFLDTLPYNAHTTASDALWAGLPVLTRIGEAFAARVAASLLNAIGLSELIATTREQYETLAVQLATNPKRLDEIRKKLAQNRLTTPLFDTELFARQIEDGYTQMYERYQEGLPPEHIHVRP